MAQVKEVKGPGPRRMGGPKPKVENPGKLLKRIMDEVFKHYLPHCILVLICIIVSALANVQASLFLKTLIDDYIVPMTKQATPDFGPLAGALVRIGCIYAIGVLAAWLNARIMVNVTQGTLRNLRVQLFTHMESLPIRYFDSHPHGDIMSVYTNDVDTLRQMISQSIPQLVSSAITIVSVFTSMCLMSWQLTVVTMLMVALMLFCSKKITAMSGKYFVAQQKDLGKVNGYIEEMMEGQKVVKVFTHEQKALDGFRQLNDKLKESAKQANSYANIIMPVTAQLGNTSYAVCALAGAAMAVGNVGGMTLGTVMAFLSLNKSFNMPISQVLQAEYHLNRNFALGGGFITLNQFYEFLGIEPVPGGDEVGWMVSDGLYWVDFDHQRTVVDDGLNGEVECWIIDAPFPPVTYEEWEDMEI
mgnify:CR=1 FL=1